MSIIQTKIHKLDIEHYMENGLSEQEAIGRLFLREYSDFVFFQDKFQGYCVDEHPPINEIIKDLEYAKITNIWYNEETKDVHIKMGRPGIFIGVKGENISKVEKHWKEWAIKMNIPFKGIKIEEDRYTLEDDLKSSIINFSYSISDPDF